MRTLCRAAVFALIVAVGGLLGVASAGAAPSITEFPVTTKDRGPLGVAGGPEGNVWFAESAGSGGIGKITSSGTITEFTTGLSGPAQDIVPGPDGNLWFTEPSQEVIGRITPEGTITEFPLPKKSMANEIAAGSDGNLWFTETTNPGRIGRITPAGAITEFTTGLTSNSQPNDIAAGPDGNLWFTETANPGRIGRITPSGTITEFTSGLTANSQPTGITAGADGNLWFTETAGTGRIGRITITGTVTEFTAGLTANSQPDGITAGNNGNLYFTELNNPGRIGTITPAGAITELATSTVNGQPERITSGGNGNVWFSEAANHGRIGTMTIAPSTGGGSASSTETTAILKAQVGANSQATSYHFDYGPTAAYGSQTGESPAGGGSIQVPVSAAVGPLTPASTYHFRVVATNASGTTYGADQTLTTTQAPAAAVGPATSVSLATATVRGTVNPAGQPTSYRFEWGTTTEYGSSSAYEPVGADTSDHAVEQALTGLTPDTSYYYRVVATNCGGCAEGTTVSSDALFTTAAPPTATTEAAQELGMTQATLTGVVSPNEAPTTYHFEWGETTAYGMHAPAADTPVGSDGQPHRLTSTLTGLQPGTTYHFRIVASNCGGCASGTSYGNDVTLTTAALSAQAPGGPAFGGHPPAPAPPRPVLGKTAVIHVLAGNVTIHAPGSPAAAVTAAGTVVMGSMIDVSHGIIELTSAEDAVGHSQSATLWGAAFAVNQKAARHGPTTFTLTGRPRDCGRHTATKATAAATGRGAPRPSPSLWAKDNHGHFSTRGHNSVATVRGTYWDTVERCDGTLTIVRRGLVAVRANHHRGIVLVRAGHSYLARP